MMNLLGCSKENFYKLMTYMNYKKDNTIDTYVLKEKKRKRRKFYSLTKMKIQLITSFLNIK